MSTSRVISVPRYDFPDKRVLVGIDPHGEELLDFDLVATDGAAVYVGKSQPVRKSQLGNLRAKAYKGNDKEWQAVLGWAFLRQRPQSVLLEFISQIDLVAAVHGGQDEIVLTLRQVVSGITQRLGNFPLNRDDDRLIELFDWSVTAASATSDVETQVTELQSRYDSQQETINKLTSQLKDLVLAKQKHEDELLEKFRHLLNSKKAKIRDQMRLLSSVKIDASTAQSIRNTRGGKRTEEYTKPSRKRKAREPMSEKIESESDEPQMADEGTGLGKSEDDKDFERAPTPSRSDLDATEDEEMVEESLADRTRTQRHMSQSPQENATPEAPPVLPPKRDLPFSHKSTPVVVQKPAMAAEEEDDVTDDEL